MAVLGGTPGRPRVRAGRCDGRGSVAQAGGEGPAAHAGGLAGGICCSAGSGIHQAFCVVRVTTQNSVL